MKTHGAPLPPILLLLILILIAQANADLYGNPPASISPVPAPPPPFKVAGKPFPPQNFTCNDPRTRCFNRNITCPPQCPEIKPADQTAKGCFVDCNSPNCEAICRNRKPNCDGIGAACFDPRFVGGDGVMFYFHGKTNQHFSLVSDTNLQINAHFIGRRPHGRRRDNTWIQALSLMFDSHSFTLAATKVSKWDDHIDHFLFTYNQTPLFIQQGHLSTWAAPDSPLTVDRTANCNSITLTLAGKVEISVTIVPITKEDDRIHNYQIPSDDCFAHLELQFRFFHLSHRVEGVLGKTYQPDFESPVKRGVPMPIMGGEDKYKTSSLLSSDCKRCIFDPELVSMVDPLALDTTTTLDCTSKISNGRGVVCRR